MSKTAHVQGDQPSKGTISSKGQPKTKSINTTLLGETERHPEGKRQGDSVETLKSLKMRHMHSGSVGDSMLYRSRNTDEIVYASDNFEE